MASVGLSPGPGTSTPISTTENVTERDIGHHTQLRALQGVLPRAGAWRGVMPDPWPGHALVSQGLKALMPGAAVWTSLPLPAGPSILHIAVLSMFTEEQGQMVRRENREGVSAVDWWKDVQ